MLKEIEKMIMEEKLIVTVEDHLEDDIKSLVFMLKDTETEEEIFLTELVIGVDK